jgi:hypothetical protein
MRYDHTCHHGVQQRVLGTIHTSSGVRPDVAPGGRSPKSSPEGGLHRRALDGKRHPLSRSGVDTGRLISERPRSRRSAGRV